MFCLQGASLHMASSADGLMRGCYPGGKNLSGLWQWIIDRQPPHAGYVEAFVGSGGILRRKPPALRTVALDLDPVVTGWLTSLALPGVEVLCGDGVRWLEEHGQELDEDWLAYLDPPYHPHARVKLKVYQHEMTARQHLHLLDVACGLKCRVMLSGYQTPHYALRLAGWHVDRTKVITRGGTLREESLWMNFDPRATAAFVRPRPGKNYRERERIGRKIARWERMYAAMPAHERRALLATLIEKERGMR